MVKDWYTNVPQILLNNSLYILKSEHFLLLVKKAQIALLFHPLLRVEEIHGFPNKKWNFNSLASDLNSAGQVEMFLMINIIPHMPIYLYLHIYMIGSFLSSNYYMNKSKSLMVWFDPFFLLFYNNYYNCFIPSWEEKT